MFSRLELTGLYHSDVKRPDGISVVLWKNDKLLVWDATCPDTFAHSHSSLASGEAGTVAAKAEVRKYSKYCHLDSSYTFVPVVIETSGAMRLRCIEFLRELGYRLRQDTGEVKASIYLLQCRSVAIQRGNSASILGTISLSDTFGDFP